ncbi:MAG: hypothetical protein U0X91_28760 [Spirosomataceae bacterium]
MITKEHLKIYERFSGDGDRFARVANGKQRSFFEKGEWSMIKMAVFDLGLIKKKLTSEEFKNKTLNELRSNCESADTYDYLIEISNSNKISDF